MRRSGIEPDIHDVHFFGKFPVRAARMREPFRQQVFRFSFEPDVRSEFADQFRSVVDRFRRDDRFSIFRIEDRQRNAPDTLTGNDPIAAVADHVEQADFAGWVQPLYIFDFVQNVLTEFIDGCEPLRRCAIDDRFLCAPVMRIAVDEEIQFQQSAFFRQQVGDRFIGFVVEHALETRGFSRIATFVVDRR